MINLFNINKMCKCGKHESNFNYPGLKAEYCSDCKTEAMINVKHKKCHCGKAIPYFNYPVKAEYCSDCKTEAMIDVKHKMSLWKSTTIF